jgi:putative drug exporter of the RND superfamily
VFTRLARFDVRFRWIIVAAWIAAAIAIPKTLPSLADVVNSNNAQFLSASAPSVQAQALAEPFLGRNPSSTAIIVAATTSGPLTVADNAAITRAEQLARHVPGVSLVRDEGTSRDGQAREALVASSSGIAGTAAKDVVDGIRAAFGAARAPAGLSMHLTGQLAQTVDAASTSKAGSTTAFSLIFIVVLLLVVFRSALAPLITLIPAGLSLAVAEPVIAEAAKHGMSVASIVQLLLIVLVLGAGTDYGLFLVFRVREELGGGTEPREAVVRALTRVGETITYSAITVIAALLNLLIAPFGIYQHTGPALAIGLAVMLLAGLTLTPALLAISGRAAFWPSRPRPGAETSRTWQRIAAAVVRRPAVTLAAGAVIFGALAAGLAGYTTSGFVNGPPAGSDSAAGAVVLAAHFPRASAGADQLLLRYPGSVWQDPAVLARAQRQLAASPVFGQITGPLGTGPGQDSLAALAREPRAALAQFISPDGRTISFYASMAAGPPGSAGAINAIPAARTALAEAARSTGAQTSGITGQDASSYDINSASSSSLIRVIPVVLVLILVLLALLLRSLIAPWYLVITVGLSYLAALGFGMIVFVHLGSQAGLNFVLSFLLFIFAMALGEDYNILVMTRIREEAARAASLRDALTRAIGVTGKTVTSAGIILAGTFAVLGLTGSGNTQVQEVGFSIAFGIVLVTFFVQTLLNPAIAVLLGRWNWWPSRLSRPAASPQPPALPSPAREHRR